MAMHTYAEMSSATMRSGFPTPPEPAFGAPNLFILNDLLQYVCKCVQPHKSTISKKMNLLYVMVDPGLCTHYSAGKAYPDDDYPFPDDVNEVPDFMACNNDNNHATAKITHTILLKTRNDVINMNTALIDTLLGLIPMSFKLLFEQEWMMDPNTVFCQCFDWFVNKYGRASAKDSETNLTAMAANLHPSMGFEVLTSHLFCGVTFASLSGHPITDEDTVGIFTEEYKTWTNAINFAAFELFWENAVRIAVFTSIPVSQHGYGMAACNPSRMRCPILARIRRDPRIATIQHGQHHGNPRATPNALPSCWQWPAPLRHHQLPTAPTWQTWPWTATWWQ